MNSGRKALWKLCLRNRTIPFFDWAAMFFREVAEGIILNVRIMPNASVCGARGVFTDADGAEYLKISVVSIPEKGKANKELLSFLAKRLKTAKSNFEIISGASERCKRILIKGIDAVQAAEILRHKAASEIGMECRISYVPQNAGEADLRDLIIDLNDNFDVNGIIVQLPLPPQFDALQILSMISYHKDVDGFSPYNAGLLQMNNSEAVVAATPGGVYELLKDIPGGLSGKHALIIGRSNIVGRPLADLLLNHDCTVTVAHSKTVNLPLLCREADIVIAACGCPRLVKGDWIKPGAAVIDVGINRVDGKLVGDVDFDDVKEKAGFITPVPGGVGPMTVAMLLQNTWRAYLKQHS